MIWNEARECMSRDELMTLQEKRLVVMVKKVYHSVAYYRKKMQQKGIEPGDIRRIEDLDKLPFTTKEDLIQNNPFDIMAVAQSEIIRYHNSNGTTGTQITVGCTRSDIGAWAECVARCISMAELGRNDTIQIMFHYGLFTGLLEAYGGAERVGAAVVPMMMCNTRSLIDMMKELNVTGILCTPSYLLHIGQVIEELHEIENLKLKTAICETESWSLKMRRDIERRLGISTYDIYGLSELGGLGVACDCIYHNGLHVQEDFFVTEILEKDTDTAAKDGKKGELVFTTLHREGTPLIRYRTGDVTTVNREPCQCGRTYARIGPFDSKASDTIFIRGVSVFRFQLENMFDGLNMLHVRYLMRIYRVAKLDMIDVVVELDEPDKALFKEKEEMIKSKLVNAVRRTIGVVPKVYLVGMGVIPHTVDKNSVIVDERQYD